MQGLLGGVGGLAAGGLRVLDGCVGSGLLGSCFAHSRLGRPHAASRLTQCRLGGVALAAGVAHPVRGDELALEQRLDPT
jgi:hypothetical protein